MLYYGLLLILFLLLLYILYYVFFNIYMYKFGAKVEGTLLNVEIVKKNMASHEGVDEWYFLRVRYKYTYNDAEYVNDGLNSLGSLFRRKKETLESIINQNFKDNKATIYVFPLKPHISYCLPMHWNNIMLVWFLFLSVGIGGLMLYMSKW